MLPLQQSYEIREAVLEYIRATYGFKEKDVSDSFFRFIEDERNGMFKGPYVSIKTPFVKSTGAEDIPLEIKPSFAPHLHQIKAFERLTCQGGHKPQPTLLTTGTGSGKTECFLFPVLDYVYHMNQDEKQKGVKVIIMYPMNALATDQAKRLAEAIWNDDRLRGKVTAGLFIGRGQNDSKKYPTTMSKDHIIEDRKAIVDTAPDILLTNFKMLDYGLMYQEYMDLWTGNIDVPHPMLKYLVLDELHTYDGAQGTDVANLIRRLKLKLGITQGNLTPVGTSATIGNDADGAALLRDYASNVFGESFEVDSVITETRVSVDEFCDPNLDDRFPSDALLSLCQMSKCKDAEEYLLRCHKAWFNTSNLDAVTIGKQLRRLRPVYDLLSITSERTCHIEDLKNKFGERNASFRAMQKRTPHIANAVVESLIALICQARIEDGGHEWPMLYCQIQMWQRELSGILRYLQPEPEFTWRDSILHDERIALPMYFCRDCGASGWISTKKATSNRLSADIRQINSDFMADDKDVLLLNIDSPQHTPIDEYTQSESSLNATYYLNMQDLSITSSQDEDAVKIVAVSRGRSVGTSVRFEKRCPECMSESIAIVGGRTSTLSSVAVSQLLSSDFESGAEGERKVLTFSNSVQDAAHLAGFYEVRTYRFLMRQSIQQYLKYADREMTLADLQKGFKQYWKKQLTGDEYYHRFIPDEFMESVDLTKNYRNTSGTDFMETFKREFDLRVDWEICSEFGYMSQIGRTLEKMGSSATFFKRDDIADVFETMVPWLEDNNLAYLTKQKQRVMSFINAILHRIRMRGGVDHEFLRAYRTEKLTLWNLKWTRREHEHFLNKQFTHNRVPRMIGYQHAKGKEILDTTSIRGGRKNWFYTYFVKALVLGAGEMMLPAEEVINDFYKELLETLCSKNILNKSQAGDLFNYAIRPEALWVEASVKHIRCSHCQATMRVAKSDLLTEGCHCLDIKCISGVYVKPLPIAMGYYHRVYNRAISPRIYASEHTGLLDRQIREDVEDKFKSNAPNTYNVLTATSTLEMGIDIGTLNVVSNTSVPPLVSNFKQRVGRAGRKDGSALILNYAHSSQAHDMFYYAEPMLMMEGAVSTPGCFLEAKDILRRHFLAYCIDSWTSADRNHHLPIFIKDLQLSFSRLAEDNFFVNRIGRFIAEHKTVLIEKFRLMYPQSTQEVLNLLQEAVIVGALHQAMVKEFTQLVQKIDEIQHSTQEYKGRLKQIPVNDIEKRKELINQINGIDAQLKKIGETSVIEFMTNKGLLPNYAFPETGVSLEGTIYNTRQKGDDAMNALPPKALELVRPASQGIKELAPGNLFYTQKLHLRINGLGLSEQKDAIIRKRFCSHCDALADEGTTDYNQQCCPKCGSNSWQSNEHRYLRFTTAIAKCTIAESAMDDKSDDRDRERYHTMKHFRFEHHGAITSYGLKNVGFGIEYCKDVTMTEVNYGCQQQMANPIEINNTPRISNLGFVTCRYCGRSTAILYGQQEAKDMHYPFCNHKDVAYPPQQNQEGTFDYLYLYRTMQTEAIKVLLPVQIFDTNTATQLFKAGLELGLKYYYQSSPEHIRIDGYSEFNKATGDTDTYLVIYDVIPGGTGYLSKLFTIEEFSRLIRLSYEKIRDCNCRREGKDGCYHCILSYGNQWMREQLSREEAEQLFERIINHLDAWEEIHGSIGTLTQSGIIEDSELEILFTKAMEKVAKQHSWIWQRINQVETDSYYYELLIEDDNIRMKYAIRPQYTLSKANGVEYYTRPDFQFICVFAEFKGQEVDVQTLPQWSVYLDGYAYHAKEGNMRFYDDLARREAILHSNLGPKNVWILTWDDINGYFETENSTKVDELFVPSPIGIDFFPNTLHKLKNSLERFVFAITHPNNEELAKEVFNYIGACWTEEPNVACAYRSIENALSDVNNDSIQSPSEEELDNEHFYAKSNIVQGDILMKPQVWYMYDADDGMYRDSVRYNWHLSTQLSRIEKEEWARFWRVYNLLQFYRNQAMGDIEESDIPKFEEIELFFPGLEEVVKSLLENKIPFNYDGGFTLQDEDGIEIASASIGWSEQKLVIIAEGEDSAPFIAHGYTIITADEFNIENLKSHFNK